MKFSSVYGVDFSGGKQAGRTTWIAHARPTNGRLRLVELRSLESLCGGCERAPALQFLVDHVAQSDRALWGMDFPFGLPVELFNGHSGATWPGQIRLLNDWADGAYDFGLWCVDRTRTLHGKLHLKRETDVAAKAPFDCYHYRIIYQMFHGMRDVLGKLAATRGTAILPFQYRRLANARRVVVESCPSSTLKRWRLPHQNYKQAGGGALTPVRRRTRRAILDAVCTHVTIDDRFHRMIMRDPGGDALDAVIAAAGALQAYRSADHAAIARHPRYRHEGYLYV